MLLKRQNERVTGNVKRCIAADLRVMSSLQPELLTALQSIARTLHFEAGQAVVHEGERPNYVGAVTEGILKMQKTFPDGREHIVGLLVEGDMFGRVHHGAHTFSMEAATNTTICAFPRTRFESLIDAWPELEQVVLLDILDELDRAREWMLVLANHRTTERLAGFLVVLCRRWANVAKLQNNDEQNPEIQIPLSRRDLAHFLGARPESISRAFHALADDLHIRIKTPYDIEILDLQELIGMCGLEDFAETAAFEYRPSVSR
ncbi:MAG: Crp/Fnr family transcriptional regulator [Alphaproteobacteria bacterium]|nr:Crp/Fnr family transcriptional regulator [Alphaproteobacteria bacterium]